MHDETAATITPSDLRAAIARSGQPIYVIGAACRINPVRMSRILHGREPITVSVAERILRACAKEPR
jgi:hypothetical protein